MTNLNLDTASREELIEGLVFLMNAKSEDFDRLSKNKLEFSRYKQDCRKRALEIAYDRNKQLADEDIFELADKYYKWLINLPQ